jgi:hypothetical protein
MVVASSPQRSDRRGVRCCREAIPPSSGAVIVHKSMLSSRGIKGLRARSCGEEDNTQTAVHMNARKMFQSLTR